MNCSSKTWILPLAMAFLGCTHASASKQTTDGTTAPSAVGASSVALPKESPDTESKPDDERLQAIARDIIVRSEDAKVFRIDSVKIANSLTEGKTMTVKVSFTVTSNRSELLFSSTGQHHVLPLGSIRKGQRFDGRFKVTMKEYDKGWEVDGYERE